MACNPPNCLEIPPRVDPSTGDVLPGRTPFPVCGWSLQWYEHFPILLGLSGPDEPSLDLALNGIAAAGGRIYSLRVGFLASDGSCQFIDILYPYPGNPNPSGQPQVTCPPGFTYDPVAEACVFDSIVIVPPPPPPTPPPPITPPPPTTPPPPAPPPGGGFGTCANPNCIIGGLIGDAKPGVLSPACLAICAASGKPDDVCDQTCCQLCVSDPPADFLELRFRQFPAPAVMPIAARKSIVEAPTSSLAQVFMANPSNRGNRGLKGR